MIMLNENFFRTAALKKLRLFESELKLNLGFIENVGPFEARWIKENILILSYDNQEVLIAAGTNGDERSAEHRRELNAMLVLQSEIRVNDRPVELGNPVDDVRRIGEAVTREFKGK